MTDFGVRVDLTEAQRLTEAATPGPWVVEMNGGIDYTGEGWSLAEIAFSDPLEANTGLTMGDHENRDADAEFIAWCRTAVPGLIGELTEARQQLETAQQRIDANELDR